MICSRQRYLTVPVFRLGLPKFSLTLASLTSLVRTCYESSSLNLLPSSLYSTSDLPVSPRCLLYKIEKRNKRIKNYKKNNYQDVLCVHSQIKFTSLCCRKNSRLFLLNHLSLFDHDFSSLLFNDLVTRTHPLFPPTSVHLHSRSRSLCLQSRCLCFLFLHRSRVYVSPGVLPTLDKH